LEKDRRGGAVDAPAQLPLAESLIDEPIPGFPRGQSFVDELDGTARPVAELGREAAGAARRWTFAASKGSRQPYEEQRNALLFGHPGQGIEQGAAVLTVEEGARMGHQAELVRHGDAHSHLAEVDGQSPHLFSLPSTIPEDSWPPKGLPKRGLLDPTERIEHKRSARRLRSPRGGWARKFAAVRTNQPMQYRAAKGMNDILPEEVGKWQALEAAFRKTVALHRYTEVRTPLIEPTELFVRSVGETTDIVQKEMFTFQHHDDSLTLRPEGTASAARAYIEHTVHAREPVTRWFYIGPMFRAERPQRGRYRQFFQAGCEVFGDPGPAADAEMIDMLHGFFHGLGVEGLTVLVNSMGGPGTRERYRDVIREHLKPHEGELSEASKQRLADNPLRILDSKNPRDQELVAAAPATLDVLDAEDRAHWDGLRRHLDALGVPYRYEPRLVRGLDYYTRTLFEIQASTGNLGAQNALGGGGRYDAMVKELGGPDVPALGFAIGLDRVLLAMPEQPRIEPASCFVAPMGDRAAAQALVLARELRSLGVPVDVDGRGGSLKSMMRRANGSGARLCVIIGDTEIDRGVLTVKDLAQHSQEEVPRADAASALLARLGQSVAERREGSR
jgi:histidyl-tRNA synthetase